MAAYQASPRGKMSAARHRTTEKGKASKARYASSGKQKKALAIYYKSLRGQIVFAKYAKSEKRKQSQKAWLEKNRHVRNASTAKRAANRIRATPNWANPEELKQFYRIAAELTEKTGIKHHVDHIIPLQNSIVCGLHVPNNLRVITAKDNLKKNNSYSL